MRSVLTTVIVLLVALPLCGEPAATQPAALPHLRVDRRHRRIDIDANIVSREAQWIELLACTPKSREYESILTVRARPSHIHLALMTLGLEAGAPMKWHYTDESVKVDPPRGPRLRVSIITQRDGKPVEVPAGRWIVNRKTGKTLEDATWVFAGSEFAPLNGQQVYRADINGTVISIVNFGDDLLARQTTATNHTDDAAWGINTKLIPPIGTRVTLRLTVVPDPPTTQPADQ